MMKFIKASIDLISMRNDYAAIFMFYKSVFIPCLIGPSQVPPEKVDTYLAPVVKELNQLWEGVEAIDDKGPFTLKAILMWGIHDYPGMRTDHKTLIHKSRTQNIAILECAKHTTSHHRFAHTSQEPCKQLCEVVCETSPFAQCFA